jgi:RecB family exonuclease
LSAAPDRRNLVTLLVDIRPENRCETRFLECLSARTEAVETISANIGSSEPFSSQLAALRAQLFTEAVSTPVQQEGVEFFSASGEALECVEIARRILISGKPFDQCAILLRNPGRYRALIEDAMRRAQIPTFFTRGTLRPDSAGRAFLALLHCADEGLTASRFAEYLSHEQMEQPFGWERLLVDAAVVGGKERWERRLGGLAAELTGSLGEARTDEERAKIRRQLERLDNLAEFALPRIEQLSQLRAPRRWGEWIDDLGALGDDVPENVLDLLAELEPMREIGPVGLPDVIRLLEPHLSNLRNEPKGNRYGRVFVGSIEEARGLIFEHVYVPGLCEGAFPKTLFDDPLLPGNLERLEEQERRLLRQACATATASIVFSWPRMELSSGRVRVPSFYVLEAARAATGTAVDRRTIERRAEEPVETRIGWPAPADPQTAIDDAEYDLARLRPAVTGMLIPGLGAYLTQTNPILARSLTTRFRRWEKAWRSVDGLTISKDTVPNPLEAYRLTVRPYSPSSLQKYASCPYRFGLSAILGLTPMKEAAALERLDRMTRGSLFHEVQKRFIPTLTGYPQTAEALEAAWTRLDAVLQEVGSEYAEALAPAIDEIWQNEIARLRADLRSWLLTVSNESGWRPLDVERSFEDLTIEGGWLLRGRMDLVEESGRNSLRITDYKTGAFPKTPPEITGGGEVLQPLLYAMAAEQLYSGKSVEGGQLFFATLRGGYGSVVIRLDDRGRAEAGQVLATIDNALNRGVLLAAPREGACETCDYRVVCGPYEEERVGRKPPDRLEPLVQLRGVK